MTYTNSDLDLRWETRGKVVFTFGACSGNVLERREFATPADAHTYVKWVCVIPCGGVS